MLCDLLDIINILHYETSQVKDHSWNPFPVFNEVPTGRAFRTRQGRWCMRMMVARLKPKQCHFVDDRLHTDSLGSVFLPLNLAALLLPQWHYRSNKT